MPTLNDRSTSDLALGAVLGSAATVAATVLLKKGMAHSGSSSRVSSGHSVLTQMLSFFERSWGVTSLNEGKDPKSLDSEIMKFADPSCIREAMDKAGGFNLRQAGLDQEGTDGDDKLMKMLEVVADLSVNTSHPLFLNQLFGAMDRASLAAELMSVCQNTSSYTFEAAPVNSVVEMEVMRCLASVIGWDFDNSCDGLMMPGGSLSNLMALHCARHQKFPETLGKGNSAMAPRPMAFVSAEAHYSFLKAISVLGLGRDNLVKVATGENGEMSVNALKEAVEKTLKEGGTPFFVGATAGSTVRGTFDPFAEISTIAKEFGMWMHVDGAWGGPAIFSDRDDMKELMRGTSDADSFTFNPHKMLGAPLQTTCFICHHKGALLNCNSSNAGYLFDTRKANSEYDVGDQTFMCGRKTDALKFWAMWRFRGTSGIANRVNGLADATKLFVDKIQEHPSFMLACKPWPFNMNFFFIPKRIRLTMEKEGIATDQSSNLPLPENIAKELDTVAIDLKTKLMKAGKAMIPFQPLANQDAQVFRVCLAGDMEFGEREIAELMRVMVEYGDDM
ncbi:hypothetical protein TrLO_g6683 [Triparma laevis f. longispina]|uniref:Glutamate decarboxylase n=1 Tax=Triparma laevis f. longispina TaxID=1714387 RepID=A0A9W7C822_9STRA|nr:hypothetical protein TrLO_g6683 [Triparma laevis f. longispina]